MRVIVREQTGMKFPATHFIEGDKIDGIWS